MDFISVKDTAKKWGTSERWVQLLCLKGRIVGASKFGRSWLVPHRAEKPIDARYKPEIFTANKSNWNYCLN